MRAKYLAIVLLLLIIASCAPRQPADQPSGKKSCSQLNGFICKGNEKCSGSLLASSDSSKCCSEKCTLSQVSGNQNAQDLPQFNFGKTDNENAFGELNAN